MAKYAVVTTNGEKSSLYIINLGKKAAIMASGANYTRLASIMGKTSPKDLALILMATRSIALQINKKNDISIGKNK